MFERAKKRRTRWSVVASTRCACLFEIDKKKFQLPPEREGTTARFFPLIHRIRESRPKKKNEPQTGRIFGNARRTLARDVRAMPAKGASSRAWSSSSKQKSSSHRGSHHVLVVSRCVFLKWRLTRDCFFFSQKHREEETERERERERERDERRERRDTNTRAKKHHPALFFYQF